MPFLSPLPSFMLCIVMTYISALLSMAFFTLLERKALGYFQLRKGPNKVGIAGLPQPLADALKLFTKESNSPALSNPAPFIIAPMTALFLALILWTLYPHSFNSYFITAGVLLFLCISSVNVYTILGAGWSSNSKYALLGALRGVAQTISYEVSMALILISALVILQSLSTSLMFWKQIIPPMLMCLPLVFTWLTTCLAETNRTPFDFAEGESELVSGFNTEYSSGLFALIFMAEYMNILLMSIFTSLFFFSFPVSPSLSPLMFSAVSLTIAFFFIWVRASYPRMRYDRLMSLTWKSFLPFSLCAFMLILPMSKLLMM